MSCLCHPSYGKFFCIKDPFLFLKAIPNTLNYLIAFITNDDEQWKGYLYMITIIVLNLGKTITVSQYFYGVSTVGLRIRTALTSAIYKKALRLCPSTRKERTGTVQPV